MNREELRNRLKSSTQRVEFIKKNGDRRVMICTLRKDILQSYGTGTKRQEPSNLLTVWDCDAQGWRRVNLDTLISVDSYEVS